MQVFDIGVVKSVFAALNFVLQLDIAISAGGIPLQLKYATGVLQRHRNAL